MIISKELLDTLSREKVVDLLTKLSDDANNYTCSYRESVPQPIRDQLPVFLGYVTGVDVAKAFKITDRHGRRLLSGI